MKKFIIVLVATFFCQLAVAQVNQTRSITLEAARKVAAAASLYARENKSPGGSIAIVDAGGHLVYLERLEGSFPASADVAIQKARTAAEFKTSSRKLEESVNGGRNALITVGRTFLKGGIPILYQGEVIGAIGVSGAASADQDEEIAIAGSKAELK